MKTLKTQRLIVEVNCTVYLITKRIQKYKKLHKAAIVHTLLSDVSNDLYS